jgi:hypothetical protein
MERESFTSHNHAVSSRRAVFSVPPAFFLRRFGQNTISNEGEPMTRFVRFTVAAFLLAIVGCQTGTGIITYDKGSNPILAQAPSDGEYALYCGQQSDPKVTYYLKRGDALGFKVSKTGEIIAVAGSAENAVPDDNYAWRRHDPAQPAAGSSSSGSH